MSILDRCLAYADAFEESFEDDDWSRIEPFFTEDAVYEGGPEDAHGRDAVLAKLKGGVDAFDRNMDSRTPDFERPTVDGDRLNRNRLRVRGARRRHNCAIRSPGLAGHVGSFPRLQYELGVLSGKYQVTDRRRPGHARERRARLRQFARHLTRQRGSPTSRGLASTIESHERIGTM